MFLRLNESRKDRDTGEKCYKPVLLNMNNVTHVQPPTNAEVGRHTYIGIVSDKFMFVKESMEEIEKLINLPASMMKLLDRAND